MWDITTPTVGARLLAVSCTGRDLERWKVTIPADHPAANTEVVVFIYLLQIRHLVGIHYKQIEAIEP